MTEIDPLPPGWRIYIDSRMDAVELFELAGGRAAVYSAPRPEKTSKNEDAALLAVMGSESAVLGVADGAGGLLAGAEAARLAITHLARELAGPAPPEVPLHERIRNGLLSAHDSIERMGVGAATTFAGIEIVRGEMRSVHAGDSMVLVIAADGGRKHRTVAHSPVGYALEAGVLSEVEAIFHQDLHLVSNLLGVETPEIEVSAPLQLAPGDTVVIGSDGLFDNLLIDEIAEMVSSADLLSAAVGLVEETVRRMTRPAGDHPSKPDDLAFILFRLEG
ncbi:MAG: SpoIIE family protein phosphatase [Planctomycetota bacterium]